MLEKLHYLNSMLVIKCVFEKGFTPNWTEVFTIATVKATKRLTYIIKDTLGVPVVATFYEQELQSSVQETYRIELVLKRGKYRVFVKWKGYNDAFNDATMNISKQYAW